MAPTGTKEWIFSPSWWLQPGLKIPRYKYGCLLPRFITRTGINKELDTDAAMSPVELAAAAQEEVLRRRRRSSVVPAPEEVPPPSASAVRVPVQLADRRRVTVEEGGPPLAVRVARRSPSASLTHSATSIVRAQVRPYRLLGFVNLVEF